MCLQSDVITFITCPIHVFRLKDVTSDSPTKTATKIPIPTFPAAGGLSHMRSPSRSFANNSILSLDTSFDVTIHQSTAV